MIADPKTDIPVGVVGLGLMGSSIIAALLLAGHRVKAIAPVAGEKKVAASRIENQLVLCEKAALLTKPRDAYRAALVITDNYQELNDCRLVLECVTENVEIKASVYKKIITVVGTDAIIGSNTSAIPISVLQQYVDHPERFIGIHWAEPAFATRFMEITCGSLTAAQTAGWVFKLAHLWGKEPTMLKKDIRGFITNRLMYAVYREGLHLAESGQATLEDIDKAFRYDTGSWITLMGIFRRMDFLGLKDYAIIFDTIFPQLSNADEVPALMQRLTDMQASGTQSLQGLYTYTQEEAKDWEEAFASFSRDIYQLASRYPAELM